MSQINTAFETLGNPQKRSQYDRHLLALERWSQGLRVDTSGVQPHMFVPKEFMMCPLGYPDRFARCVGGTMSVHSREEARLGFNEFFGATRLAATWLPQGQGLCRLRALPGAGTGPAGMHLSFPLSAEASAPQVVLSAFEEPQACFAAVASPDFQGAFRFEVAELPGQRLVFEPPSRLCVASGGCGGQAVTDFVLVDCSLAFRYMTLEEVLVPLVERLGGAKDFVNISLVREDKATRLFFSSTLQRIMWSPEDFQAYFEGHWQLWDYDARSQRVRLRSSRERLAHFLRTAKARPAAEVAAALAGLAGEDGGPPELGWLPQDTAEAVLCSLDGPPEEEADEAAHAQHVAAQLGILTAIPAVCRKAPPQRLLDLHARCGSFGGRRAAREVVAKRQEVAQALVRLAGEAIREHGLQGRDASAEAFLRLCKVPLDWERCGEMVRASLATLVAVQPLDGLLPLLRAAADASARAPAAALAAAVQERLPAAGPTLATEAYEALASGGFALEAAPGALRRLAQNGAPFDALAAAVAALGEKDAAGEDMSWCTSFVGSQIDRLQRLPAPVLVRLTVAGTKSAAVVAGCLDAVACAAAATLDDWSMDDVAKLLLAAAKAKGGFSQGIEGLFARASAVVGPQLPSLSAAQLIKVLLAIGKVPVCWRLLEAAAMEAVGRASGLPQPQLLLLTQGLLPLGPSHPALAQTLDLWARLLDGGAEGVAAQPLAPEQLARLLQLLAPAAPAHVACWAVAYRLGLQASALSPPTRAALEAAFPDDSGPRFPGRAELLAALREAAELEEALKLTHAVVVLPESKVQDVSKAERREEKKDKARRSRSRDRRRKKKKKSSSPSCCSIDSSKSNERKRKKH